MFNFTSAQRPPSSRFVLSLILVSLTFLSGCGLFGTRKKIQVPKLLSPLSEANTPRLIAEVNRLATVNSIHGKVDIVFEDTSFAEVGIAEKYKQADGTITLQRPGKIYLVISAPFIATDIAQMTSDGEKFRVAVLQGDTKYRRFAKGTNNALYEKLEMDGPTTPPKDGKRQMTGKQTVTALSNLRPQHLTVALLLDPIPEPAASGRVYVRSEFYQEEADTRPRANSSVRIVRGYYLLEESTPATNGEARLLRRFWFDRFNGIHLARIQSFDDQGGLITDVSYFDEQPLGEANQKVQPTRIEITRPRDKYKLRIVYQSPPSVEIDKTFVPEVFVLENKWQLPEVDLDERLRNRATPQPNSPR
jgi:hypothetical protein